MYISWFESRYRRDRDRQEITRLVSRYGSDAARIARDRASQPDLNPRDRAHWRRIAAKM